MTQMTPAPRPGQKWNLYDLMDKGIEFETLMGTYVADSGSPTSVPAPALADMSLHFWFLKDKPDNQTPHKEDEAYLVLKGTGTITIEQSEIELKPGDLIFVPRCTAHHFSRFEKEGLYLLVIFGPNFTG
jgi:mannose-6-phosphate isomerase-like protein (cupin superfamily)